jgi:hypothetical protein
MTETADLLIQARFDQVANSVDERDWNDVLARLGNAGPIALDFASGRDPRLLRVPRRVAIAVALAAMTAAVTAAAFGWPNTVIDFLTSPPAPKTVKNFMGGFNVGAPPGMNPEAIPGQTRKIMTARFDESGNHPGHPRVHTLYVAPRKGGGFCELWTNADGGCAPAKSPRTTAESRAAGPLGVTWSGANSGYPLVVDGFVRAGGTKTVEARFADRTKVRLPITWVSAPINAGFFVFSVPAAHRNRSAGLRSIVALDANGTVIGWQSFPLTKPIDEDVPQTLPDGTKVSLPRSAVAAKARKIISFRATDGSKVYLWVMRHIGGGDCFVASQTSGCRIPRYDKGAPAFGGGLLGGSSRILFFGQTKPQVAFVELRYQNGESERLRPVDGFVLHEITPAHYKRGTRLVQAVAFDRSGKTILTQRFRPQEPAVYPCKKPVNRGYGMKMCP